MFGRRGWAALTVAVLVGAGLAVGPTDPAAARGDVCGDNAAKPGKIIKDIPWHSAGSTRTELALATGKGRRGGTRQRCGRTHPQRAGDTDCPAGT